MLTQIFNRYFHRLDLKIKLVFFYISFNFVFIVNLVARKLGYVFLNNS